MSIYCDWWQGVCCVVYDLYKFDLTCVYALRGLNGGKPMNPCSDWWVMTIASLCEDMNAGWLSIPILQFNLKLSVLLVRSLVCFQLLPPVVVTTGRLVTTMPIGCLVACTALLAGVGVSTWAAGAVRLYENDVAEAGPAHVTWCTVQCRCKLMSPWYDSDNAMPGGGHD